MATDATDAVSQTDVVAFLSTAGAFGGPDPVEVHETHGAMVFLAGDQALKIKRAVRYPFMDLSTLPSRRAMCEAEVATNRPFAPSIYRGVVPVTRQVDGTLAVDGDGDVVEWAVRMRRFPGRALLIDVLRAGEMTVGLATRLGDAIAQSHRVGAAATGVDWYERFRRSVADVGAVLAAEPTLASSARQLQSGLLEDADRHRDLLRARGEVGAVRRCHGDLHLGNVVVLEGVPTLFDAIEFDPEIATVDVHHDLAFLLMDLIHAGALGFANAVLNRYLWRRQDDADLDARPLLIAYMAQRAAIRGMASLLRSRALPSRSGEALDDACAYLTTATTLMTDPRSAVGTARLIAVGGLSGTGKSTLAAALAPTLGSAPGAVHLRSDLERKALAGVEPTDRLPAAAYTPESSAAVYDRALTRCDRALRAGTDVIVDAVFLRVDERNAIAAVARAAGASFHGLWLAAPMADLLDRVRQRVGDASDAGEQVVRAQHEAAGTASGWLAIEASGTPQEVRLRAAAALGLP